jgi:hypothetical protein
MNEIFADRHTARVWRSRSFFFPWACDVRCLVAIGGEADECQTGQTSCAVTDTRCRLWTQMPMPKPRPWSNASAWIATACLSWFVHKRRLVQSERIWARCIGLDTKLVCLIVGARHEPTSYVRVESTGPVSRITSGFYLMAHMSAGGIRP